MLENELYEPMRCWLEQYLKDYYKGYDIITVDTSQERLDSDDSDGIIVLEEDANKWGLELRLYLHHSPACIHATKNRAYRNDYEYRINDVDVIWELFEMGYRIGKN